MTVELAEKYPAIVAAWRHVFLTLKASYDCQKNCYSIESGYAECVIPYSWRSSIEPASNSQRDFPAFC
ncbi:hypothetical protein SAMN05192564_11613 [Paraburkholderia sartisoli]|uniref:Uncharacterized protein n=1 Tax=Paraburkholderia sartisoli TaxID=83784 RepID=A0A1H4HSX1_9BURK|nr:hypothetical protein SAMN05192564_11613 [Paraburkholderia sartisoli]